jgi:Fic family protein
MFPQLNQKLCDIRNQLASSAIGNLDLEFRLAQDFDNLDFSPDEIKSLRQQYAQELLDNKMFIFGKYATTGDSVCVLAIFVKAI